MKEQTMHDNPAVLLWLMFAVWLGCMGISIYVIAHFVIKFW
jgi:Trk-type K+ transport system membrane component